MPPDSMLNFKKSEYLQLDMQVSVLQSKLTRAERLLEELERKEAASAKAISIITKQVNRLSDTSKRAVSRGVAAEMASYAKSAGSGFGELMDCLNGFLTGIKIISTAESKSHAELCSRLVRSQDNSRTAQGRVVALDDLNKRLKRRLDGILRSRLQCRGCHTQIDVAGAVSSTRESTNASELDFPSASDNFKSLDSSKFRSLKSIKSLLNGENEALVAQQLQKPAFMNESSIFVKKVTPDGEDSAAVLDTPKNSQIVDKYVHESMKESSQYECVPAPQLATPNDAKPTLNRDLLPDFNEESTEPRIAPKLQHLDTIRSVSSDEDAQRSSRVRFQEKVARCLDSLQRKVSSIQ